MKKLDLNYFKKALEEEKVKLESELKTVGRINPENPEDWQATPGDVETSHSDENDEADSIEEFENNTAILKQLEIQINEVKHALQKIDDGSYGTCEVSGEPIEVERLEANPSARTCIKHMK
ncbi:TraR/DksA C4-type zinc finger protein [Candidatus Nomurabacteria bacterium]|nr:TraR/DksA C4-type zinc finger protein [Candidatus Nomurabacteria bacterium]